MTHNDVTKNNYLPFGPKPYIQNVYRLAAILKYAYFVKTLLVRHFGFDFR